MRRIAFINEKGGTCKTTLAVHVAAHFAKRGNKTLLVDLDTQGHAGKSLGLDVRSIPKNVFHWLTDASTSLEDVVQPTQVPDLSVVPSYKDMAEFPVAVAGDERRVHRLAHRLEEARGFDAVVFDAPPSMGLTTHNILMAATEVAVPVALTYFALDGCAEIMKTVQQMVKQHGKDGLAIDYVIPTLYRKTALADEILAKLRSYFPDSLTSTLPFNVKIDEAQSHGKTIWEYAPKSKGAQMMSAISEEICLGASLNRGDDFAVPPVPRDLASGGADPDPPLRTSAVALG